MTPYQNLVVYLWEDAVALVSFGLMARDGAMMIAGLVLGVSWIGMLLILGPVALKELIKGALAMLGIGG